MATDPMTKKQLIDKIDEKIQALNLLKSALQGERSRKPETLQTYIQNYLHILHENVQ